MGFTVQGFVLRHSTKKNVSGHSDGLGRSTHLFPSASSSYLLHTDRALKPKPIRALSRCHGFGGPDGPQASRPKEPFCAGESLQKQSPEICDLNDLVHVKELKLRYYNKETLTM